MTVRGNDKKRARALFHAQRPQFVTYELHELRKWWLSHAQVSPKCVNVDIMPIQLYQAFLRSRPNAILILTTIHSTVRTKALISSRRSVPGTFDRAEKRFQSGGIHMRRHRITRYSHAEYAAWYPTSRLPCRPVNLSLVPDLVHNFGGNPVQIDSRRYTIAW